MEAIAVERTGEEKPKSEEDRQGKNIYRKVCSPCHDSGLAGAPVVGDRKAWEDRIAKGLETLTQNAVEGIGAMPPKGGDPSLNRKEVRAAVDYMVEESR